MDEKQIERMREIGNEWTSSDGGKHRIYFNDLPGWYGLRVHLYNSGNISSARLDGETISNSQAKRVWDRLGYAKLYYDFGDGKFHGQGFNQENDDFDVCLSAIRAALVEAEVANA